MGHKRKNFSELQKAEIFARDSGTCGFSGISLWLFDYGIRPNWQMDWADHIKPSANGGNSDTENGIASSHFFNKKKRNNSHDNVYFFKSGIVSSRYIETFGVLPVEIQEQLVRLSSLTPVDWFLNRAISSVFIAFDWRCERELTGRVKKRDDEYWFLAGWKRLQKYSAKKSQLTLLERGLIKKTIPFGTEKLLRFENITDVEEYRNLCELLYPIYRKNYFLLDRFNSEPSINRKELLDVASKTPEIHPELLQALQIKLASELDDQQKLLCH